MFGALEELAPEIRLGHSDSEMNLCIFQRSQGFVVALALFGAASVVSALGEQVKDWQNPKLTGLGNQPPHADMVACSDAQTARRIEFVVNS